MLPANRPKDADGAGDGVWRVYGLPTRLTFSSMPNDKQLEDLIESDTSVLGEPVIILGRQVPRPMAESLTCLASTLMVCCTCWSSSATPLPRDVVAELPASPGRRRAPYRWWQWGTVSVSAVTGRPAG
jgi:hypothetical protein